MGELLSGTQQIQSSRQVLSLDQFHSGEAYRARPDTTMVKPPLYVPLNKAYQPIEGGPFYQEVLMVWEARPLFWGSICLSEFGVTPMYEGPDSQMWANGRWLEEVAPEHYQDYMTRDTVARVISYKAPEEILNDALKDINRLRGVIDLLYFQQRAIDILFQPTPRDRLQLFELSQSRALETPGQILIARAALVPIMEDIPEPPFYKAARELLSREAVATT